MNSTIKNLLRLIISALVLFVLFKKVGMEKILEVFSQISFFQIMIIFLTYIIVILLGALKIKILLTHTNKKINFLKFLRYYSLSWSLGMFGPGRLGEFSIAYFLKKEKIPLSQGLVVSLFDKIISLITLLFISSFGYFMFFEKNMAIRLSIYSLITVTIISTILFSKKGLILVKKYLIRFKLGPKIYNTLSLFIGKKKILLISCVITILRLISISIATFIIFLTFNQYIPIVNILIIASLTTIIASLPISMAGLGIREGIGVYLFSKVGIEPSITLTTLLMFTIITYVMAGIILTYENLMKISSTPPY